MLMKQLEFYDKGMGVNVMQNEESTKTCKERYEGGSMKNLDVFYERHKSNKTDRTRRRAVLRMMVTCE